MLRSICRRQWGKRSHESNVDKAYGTGNAVANGQWFDMGDRSSMAQSSVAIVFSTERRGYRGFISGVRSAVGPVSNGSIQKTKWQVKEYVMERRRFVKSMLGLLGVVTVSPLLPKMEAKVPTLENKATCSGAGHPAEDFGHWYLTESDGFIYARTDTPIRSGYRGIVRGHRYSVVRKMWRYTPENWEKAVAYVKYRNSLS